MLETQALTKRFGGLTAVDRVSFGVNRGEILSIIGPNGAGKSTLFKLITGFLRPTGGLVRGRPAVGLGRASWPGRAWSAPLRKRKSSRT